MERIQMRAVASVDDVCLVWRPPVEPIPDCLGFAIERKRVASNRIDVLPTWIGFDGLPKDREAKRRPSTVWPIQRYVWIDHLAPRGTALSYRVVPMVGDWQLPRRAAAGWWSRWTPSVREATGQTEGFEMYYTRGIVASQWVSRKVTRLQEAHPDRSAKEVITQEITEPGTLLRNSLGGTALVALRRQLERARDRGEIVHAALYEFHDVELIDLLGQLGDRCHLLLANGSHTSKERDRNEDVPAKFAGTGVNVTRRIVAGQALAHNKFVVFSTPDGRPQRVWTGSTNWTITGLCTETNNALLVSHPELATAYLEYWRRLRGARNRSDQRLRAENAQPYEHVGASGTSDGDGVSPLKLTGWCTPVPDQIDLTHAGELIERAEHGALFLMFQPGPAKTSLLPHLMELSRRRKFVHGVINSNPTNDPKGATITFFNRGRKSEDDFDVVMPWYLKEDTGPFVAEQYYDMIMVHSKLIVLDPYGTRPVVMTGSHNLGLKASFHNDENLLIIEGAAGLAREYATYIRTVFDSYKWRYEKKIVDPKLAADHRKPWTGLAKTPAWQTADFRRVSTREARFWLGG